MNHQEKVWVVISSVDSFAPDDHVVGFIISFFSNHLSVLSKRKVRGYETQHIPIILESFFDFSFDAYDQRNDAVSSTNLHLPDYDIFPFLLSLSICIDLEREKKKKSEHLECLKCICWCFCTQRRERERKKTCAYKNAPLVDVLIFIYQIELVKIKWRFESARAHTHTLTHVNVSLYACVVIRAKIKHWSMFWFNT